MNIRLRLLSCLLAVLMAFAPVTALAREGQVDFDKKGSISATMKETGTDKVVPGGSLMIYQIAELKEAESQLYYKFLEDYAGFEYEYGDDETMTIHDGNDGQESTVVSTALNIQKEKLVNAIVKYIDDNKLEGTELKIDEHGYTETDELQLGLYLIRQKEAVEDYLPVKTFLASVPSSKDGEVVYDVIATPKCEVGKPPVPPETEPSDKTPKRLPKTGQLWWPVPLLAATGLFFFTIGWKKRYNSR